MRWMALMVVVGCGSDPVVMPDADMPDAALQGNGTATWSCYFWPATETKCAPRCANRSLLGRYIFGSGNTCAYDDGKMCPTENMTAAADSGNAGCCVVVGGEVDFYPCQ